MPIRQGNMDVRLLGLSQKDNPRTAMPGTIIDGANWQMTKDGRVSKRGGLSALAMLDTDGVAVTGGRDLFAIGEELMLATRDKLYSRDPGSGEWAPRGRRAYESGRIRTVRSTNAVCDGTDSLLQADSAEIGRYVLALTAGGNDVGSETDSGWMLSDAVTGETLLAKQQIPTGYFGLVASDTGEATPRFIAFACEKGTNKVNICEWDADHRACSWYALITDIIDIDDRNTYGIQPAGIQAAPYAVARVDVNVWLIAYQQTIGGSLIVRKVTRASPGSYTASVHATIEATLPSVAIQPAIAWSSTAPDTAMIAACYYGTIYYGAVSVSTMAVSSTGNLSPAAWTCTGAAPLDNPYCYGVTGVVSGGYAYFFFDIRTYDGSFHRSVWCWSHGKTDAQLVVKNAALLCHVGVSYGATAASGELCLGIAHLSTWQPSALLLRLWVSDGLWTAMAFGAHLCAGDYAGRAASTLLPALKFGGTCLGILNEPSGPGLPGTVLLKLASIGTATNSLPAQSAGTLTLPGAALKSYDGQYVTEAAFPLGPESAAVVEDSFGYRFGIDSAQALVPFAPVIGASAPSPAPAEGTLSATFTAGKASLSIKTAVGFPGITAWPAGTVSISVWARILDPMGGRTYTLERGASAEAYKLRTSGTSLGWQNENVASVALTSSWQQIGWDVAVKALTANAADRLELLLDAGSSETSGETATFQIALGGAMAPIVSTPFARIETGTRLYRACLAWTDSQGRTQRSQISPATSHVNAAGRANVVTISPVITERSPVINLDSQIHPAVIEVYRTEAEGTTYYRVGSVTNVPNSTDAVVYDALPDTDLIAREQLYTTGGTVEHWPTIGANLVEQHQGRVFVATLDNLVYFTAYASAGEAAVFSSEFMAETAHVAGDITALLSLDDKLAICSATTIASLVGIGPELTGLPAYDSPMTIAAQYGPVSQRACARIPTGLAMMTAHGAFLLDRGLSLQWIGPQVTDNATGDWFAATCTPTGQQVRFSKSSLVLVYDLTLPGPPARPAQWFRWAYPTDTWAWASVEGALYQLLSNGNVYQADSGTSDYGTAYQEWIKLSLVSPAGVNGWGRIFQLRLQGDIPSGGALKIGFTNDDYGMAEDANTITASAAMKNVVAKPLHGRGSAHTIWLGENAASTGAGITIDSIGLLVGMDGGLGRLAAANRAARSA